MTTRGTIPALALREFDRDSALPQDAVELRCACFSELRRLRKVYGLNEAIDPILKMRTGFFSVKRKIDLNYT